METNTIRIGNFVIDNEPSADVVDELNGSVALDRHEGLLSRHDIRSLPFAFSLARDVNHPGMEHWPISYSELEQSRESSLHAQMRRLVATRALRAGLRVFPEGIGIQGLKTFADLLITDGQRIVFVECLTSPSAGIVARKRQLEQVAPVVFVVAPDVGDRVLGNIPGTVYLALPHLGTLALPGTYTGEPCARCGVFVPRRSFRLFNRVSADSWPDAPWAVHPIGRRALVCAACEPTLAGAVHTATQAKRDAAFREQSRARDVARLETDTPRVAAELQGAWDEFRKMLHHYQSHHPEAIPSPSWRKTEPGPLSPELANDYGAWSLGGECRRWNITKPVVVSSTYSDHYDFHRTGTAETHVGDHRLVVKFEETTRFQFTFVVEDGTKRLEGPLAGAARCSQCGADGCGRCIVSGDYSEPVKDPGKRCREAFSQLLSSPLPRSLVLELQVRGVGPATFERLLELNLTARNVAVRGQWESAVADVPRLRQQQAEVRHRLMPRLLEGAQYAALPLAKHGQLCPSCRGRVWSREHRLVAFRAGWAWMNTEWEALARS